jgi:hypothetical protein
MKIIALISTLLLCSNSSSTENLNTQKIFTAWLEMHNTGTEEAVGEFIRSYYSPKLLKKMKNFEDHVKFYMTAIDDFGDIQYIVYKTEESTDYRLKVQLLKEGALAISDPPPTEILVVEIDLDPENPQHLIRGLGMGALICYIKR